MEEWRRFLFRWRFVPKGAKGDDEALVEEQARVLKEENQVAYPPAEPQRFRANTRRHPRKASVSELVHGFFFEILASYFKNDNNYLKRTKTISAAPLNTLKIPKRH